MPDNGRVERAIRYVRDSFFAGPIAALLEDRFAGRNFADVETLNAQADEWRRGIAADRRCPGQDAISVREAFAEEAPRLLPLPDNPYPLIEQVAVKAAPDGAYSWLKTGAIRRRQNALYPLRPQRLFDSSHPCAAIADGARRRLRGPHRRRRADPRSPSAQLRQRSADRGRGAYPGPGRAKARRPPSPRHGSPPYSGIGASAPMLCPLGRGPRAPTSRHGPWGPRPSGLNARRMPGVTQKNKRSIATFPIPMPCASPSSAAVRTATSRRPSPSICRHMCGPAMSPYGPPASNSTTS